MRTCAGSTRSPSPPSWTCERADAWLLEGEGAGAKETRLGSYAEVATSIADFSRPADVTAELVDVGRRDRAADYDGKDVRGKIVLAYGSPSPVMEQAVWKRGAAGILSCSSTRLNPLADAPDQIAWQSVPAEGRPERREDDVRLHPVGAGGQGPLGPLKGDVADRIFALGQARAVVPLRVHIVVESVVPPREEDGDGRGADPRYRPVAARDRPDEPPPGGEVLGQRQPVRRREHARDRPRADAADRARESCRSRAAASGSGGATRSTRSTGTSRTTPAKRRRSSPTSTRTWSARSSRSGSRTQFMARTPWSRPSYLSDVEESVLDAVVKGNNAYLPAWQSDSHAARRRLSRSRSFRTSEPASPSTRRRSPTSTRPTTSSSTTPGSGVPGTTLTNWPDENIHSSGDDLWQIDSDAVEAQRVRRGRDDLVARERRDRATSPLLASFVAARGAERLGRELATAETWLAGRHRALPTTGTVPPRTSSTWRSPRRSPASESVASHRRPVTGSGTRPSRTAPRCCAPSPPPSARGSAAPPAAAAPDAALDRLAKPHAAARPRTTLDAWLALEAPWPRSARTRERARRRGEGTGRGARKAGKSTAAAAPALRPDPDGSRRSRP